LPYIVDAEEDNVELVILNKDLYPYLDVEYQNGRYVFIFDTYLINEEYLGYNSIQI